MGLRSAAVHAPAAFLASSAGTYDLCRQLDPGFLWEGADPSGEISASADILNGALSTAGHVDVRAPPGDDISALRQTELSEKLEKDQFQALLVQGATTDRARLRAAAAPHAGAWLNSPATSALGLRLTSAEFTAAALLRIGGLLLGREAWCSRCDQVLTQRCDHATRCHGGGDITVRHNGLRDECYYRCLSASMPAEREISGLLPSDPRRRPADVFLPTCPGLGPVALDFAVTCPLQAAMVHDAAGRTLAAAMDYEAKKLEDRQTGARCSQLGFQLIPMVVETLGGWGPAAQKLFRVIAKSSAEVSGLEESAAVCQIYEGMAIKLQRANARAILSRVSAASAARRDNTALAATSRSEAALVLSSAVAVGG